MPETRETTTIAHAAMRLRCRYQRARDLVLCGELEGWQDAAGRWHVSVASVNGWLARRESQQPKAAA